MVQKSFPEIADVLRDCGIKGITDDMISQFENRFDTIPDEIILDRTAALLTELGSGKMNYETMEWTPSNNGVYSFDMEAFDLSKMYTNFLLGIQSLDSDEIQISDIVEDDTEADWDNGTGKIKVSFVFNGSSYSVNAQLRNDWFDLDFANAIGDIIVKDNKRLWFTTDGYQECIVFFGDENWARRFSEQTGLELVRAFE